MTKTLLIFNLIMFCAFALPFSLNAAEGNVKKTVEKQNPLKEQEAIHNNSPTPPKIKLESYTNEYSPEYCDFIASFPEQPLVVKQCEKQDDPSTCYDLVSYTKVFGLSSTVKIEIICNPVTPEMYEHFTPKVMEDTVRAMTKDKVTREFNVDSKDEKFYRQAGIVAQGRKGVHDTLYIAQLWTAKNSIMSVEAELFGEQTNQADILLANILNNIGHVSDFKGEEFSKKKTKAWEKKISTFLSQQEKSKEKTNRDNSSSQTQSKPNPKKSNP